MKRNQFIRGLGITALTTPALIRNFSAEPEPQMDKAIVQEFVRVAHSDITKVKEMLAEYPNLLNAAHDWKYGDFETGLGAATHVGDKELASYFVDQGAQTDIFTACLFGHLDMLKSILAVFPKSLYAKGPHGFTLLHHAIKGEEEALPVKEYLESLGMKETKIPLY